MSDVYYIDGKKAIQIGCYKVMEHRHSFCGVYKSNELVTHKKNWKQATKLAKLLNGAWMGGYKAGYSECTHEWDIDEYQD